jgi:hypothetical protein
MRSMTSIRPLPSKPVSKSSRARSVPFVSQLAPAANCARPTQASRTRNAPHWGAPCRRINSKIASPFSSQAIQIFIHPFSSFPPLNAIKKIAHTPAARIRSTTKVGIFNLFGVSTALWPANLSAYTVTVNRRVLYVSFTIDRVAI